MALPVTTSSDIRALLDELNAAGSALLAQHPDADLPPEGPVRYRLIAAAQKLAAGLQDPLEAAALAAFQVCVARIVTKTL